MAGTRLRMELDRVPLWRGDHVSIRQLVEDFARYHYLPRLTRPGVLVEASGKGSGSCCGITNPSPMRTAMTRSRAGTEAFERASM